MSSWRSKDAVILSIILVVKLILTIKITHSMFRHSHCANKCCQRNTNSQDIRIIMVSHNENRNRIAIDDALNNEVKLIMKLISENLEKIKILNVKMVEITIN